MSSGFSIRRFYDECIIVSHRNFMQINLIGKNNCETVTMFPNHVSYLE